MSKFSSSSESKWIDPKEFDWNKVCVLEVDLKYPKELKKLKDDYPFAPVKIEIKREMLSEYQLKISDSYNIPIGIVKKDKEEISYENLQLYLRVGLKLEKYIGY